MKLRLLSCLTAFPSPVQVKFAATLSVPLTLLRLPFPLLRNDAMACSLGHVGHEGRVCNTHSAPLFSRCPLFSPKKHTNAQEFVLAFGVEDDALAGELHHQSVPEDLDDFVPRPRSDRYCFVISIFL